MRILELIQTRVFLASIAMALSLTFAASAQAENYTLDGEPTSSSTAISKSGDEGGGCSMTPSPDGSLACFTTKAQRAAAIKDSMQKHEVPPGSTAIPPKAAAAAAKKRARAAYTCDGATQVWPNSNKSGSYGWFDYVPNWTNFTSSWNNVISSDWTSSYYNAFYHDGANGSGHYFDKAQNNCHIDNALTSDAFPGGGTWNDKFTSFLDL